MNCPACKHPLTKKYIRSLSPLEWEKLQVSRWMKAWNDSQQINRDLAVRINELHKLGRTDHVDALKYATSIATGMWKRDWQSESPHWKPANDLNGVLSQIDNMLAGMEKKKGPKA